MKITIMPPSGGRYLTWEETSQVAQILYSRLWNSVSPKDAKMINEALDDFSKKIKAATQPSEGEDAELKKVLVTLHKRHGISYK